MQVKQLMSTNVIRVSPLDSIVHASHMLNKYNVGMLPVCSADGTLRGVVTDRDIVTRCIGVENSPQDTRVSEVMTRNVITASPSDDVRAASQLMASKQIRRLPVTENNKVVGVFSLADMARSNTFDMEAARALCEISSNIHKL